MKSLNLFSAASVAVAIALSGCQATSQAKFQENPRAVSKASLCRTLVETQDYAYAQQIGAELLRRGIDPNICPAMVQKQNDMAAAVAVVAVGGAAVGYCAYNDCSGPAYPSYNGNCQYDWQYDAAGNRCGHRSAWSRPGGYY